MASISIGAVGRGQAAPDLGDPVADHEHVGAGEHRVRSSMVRTMPLRKITVSLMGVILFSLRTAVRCTGASSGQCVPGHNRVKSVFPVC